LGVGERRRGVNHHASGGSGVWEGDELTQAFGLADSKAFCAIEWVTAGE